MLGNNQNHKKTNARPLNRGVISLVHTNINRLMVQNTVRNPLKINNLLLMMFGSKNITKYLSD